MPIENPRAGDAWITAINFAFVTENRLLEVGTEWLFQQVMQRLVEGHSFSSPLYQIAETEEVAELRVKDSEKRGGLVLGAVARRTHA